MTRCQFCSGPNIWLPGCIPALFIKISVPPNRSRTGGFQPRDIFEPADVDGRGHDVAGAAGRCRCYLRFRLSEAISPEIRDAHFHAETSEPHRGGKA